MISWISKFYDYQYYALFFFYFVLIFRFLLSKKNVIRGLIDGNDEPYADYINITSSKLFSQNQHMHILGTIEGLRKDGKGTETEKLTTKVLPAMLISIFCDHYGFDEISALQYFKDIGEKEIIENLDKSVNFF